MVAELGQALVEGLQGNVNTDLFLGPESVLASSKHFIADGGTEDGRDQGNAVFDETELRDIHSPGYVSTLKAGVQTVMASFSSWNGQKIHGRKDLLTDLLKDKWNFDGFVVGDWNGHGQIEGCTATDCPDAINAGLDMFMAPDSWRELYASTLEHAKAGRIAPDRLDDAVKRILRVKLRAGLFEAPKPSERPFAGMVQTELKNRHRKLAREAVRKSAVLLKNNNQLLPLLKKQRIMVAGSGANNLTQQAGGWTLSWQGTGVEKSDFPNSETIFEGIARVIGDEIDELEFSESGQWTTKPDVIVYVLGEDPYAEFRGDLATLDFKPGSTEDIDNLRRFRAAKIPVVSIFLSGRPLWVNPEINNSDAFIAAFLPGSQAGALAELLFQHEPSVDFTGKLSFSWPVNPDQYELNSGSDSYEPLFPYGYGLSYSDNKIVSPLHENGLLAEPDPRSIFFDGVATGGWTAFLEDGQGTIALGERQSISKGQILASSLTDFGRQENAISLSWTGDNMAKLVFKRKQVDFQRESNAMDELEIVYVLKQPATENVTMRLHCGIDCSEAVDVTGPFSGHPDPDRVRSHRIPLKSLLEKSVQMDKIDTFSLATTGELEITLLSVGIKSAQ